MGWIPAENWWKLITPKEMRAGMNQLKGRKILILDLVSSDILKNSTIQSCINFFSNERMNCSVIYIKKPSKESFYVCCSYLSN